MMQRLQQLPVSLKILAFAAVAAAVLALAAGVGYMAALTLGPDRDSPQGAKSERAGEVNPGQGASSEDAKKAASDAEEAKEGGPNAEDTKKGASDASGEAAYSDTVASIQNGSVEVSLQSNRKLLRYDTLTAGDVEEMKANYVALQDYARRARDLAPSAENEDQYKVFVLAISELRDANELAYRLAADPSSATQTDFGAYDRHMDRATDYLRQSNEMLGKDYKTTGAAQEISFG